jgi:hypothetical protein
VATACFRKLPESIVPYPQRVTYPTLSLCSYRSVSNMAHNSTLFSNATALYLTDTVASVEAEIERTIQYLQRLRHRLNLLRPVCRLPDEIQLITFQMLKDECTTSLDTWEWQLSSISQVCRAWRLTVHACPSLWTSIHLRNAMDADFYVCYAKNLPLDVRMDMDHESIIETALELLPRARSFDIQWMEKLTWEQVLKRLPEAKAPFLQSLTLEDEDGNEAQDEDGLRLPSSQNAPNLTRISLTCVLFSFDSLNGHNLTAVFMDCMANLLPDWPTFRSALSGFTQLEVLVLRYSIPEPWEVLEYPRVALPQLTFLDICDSLSDTARILLPMILGPHTCLRVFQGSKLDYDLV